MKKSVARLIILSAVLGFIAVASFFVYLQFYEKKLQLLPTAVKPGVGGEEPEVAKTEVVEGEVLEVFSDTLVVDDSRGGKGRVTIYLSEMVLIGPRFEKKQATPGGDLTYLPGRQQEYADFKSINVGDYILVVLDQTRKDSQIAETIIIL